MQLVADLPVHYEGIRRKLRSTHLAYQHIRSTENMHLTITAVLCLTVGSLAQQSFHIFPFEAQDGYTGVKGDPINPWSENHLVNFNISRPGAVSEQGGDAEYECRLDWYVDILGTSHD